MKDKRNVGIIGAPDSGITELFEAMLRLDTTPRPQIGFDFSAYDSLWIEEMPIPYDAKKRKKLFE